jgi:hypothetical protein
MWPTAFKLGLGCAAHAANLVRVTSIETLSRKRQGFLVVARDSDSVPEQLARTLLQQ